jgi:endoglucanase
MIEIDSQYNVIVTFNNESDKTVVIDAHSDEIGFMVNNVDRLGSISLEYIGGGDTTIMSARHVKILTENGPVNAVVDRKHSHLVADEDDVNIYHPSDADVDVGLRDREKILKMIQIGDPVVYEPRFRELTKDFYTGGGFDDKAGCYMLMRAVEMLSRSRKTLDVNVVFVFSAQEETGTSKLLPVVRRVKPNMVIEFDVTFATDYGSEDALEKEAGRCELGKGVSLYRGTDIDRNCWNLLRDVAVKNKIPYQVQACCGAIGYTSLSMTGEADGIKALVFGIPLRSMHAPTEVIHMQDLNSGTKLLIKYLQSAKLKEVL